MSEHFMGKFCVFRRKKCFPTGTGPKVEVGGEEQKEEGKKKAL